MKIRAYKKTSLKVCQILTEDIYRSMPNVNFNTPASHHRALEALKVVIKERYMQEPQVKEWSYQFDLLFVPDHNGVINLHVVLKEDWEKENLLYLDFDQDYGNLRY
jgi:hypothetical protein